MTRRSCAFSGGFLELRLIALTSYYMKCCSVYFIDFADVPVVFIPRLVAGFPQLKLTFSDFIFTPLFLWFKILPTPLQSTDQLDTTTSKTSSPAFFALSSHSVYSYHTILDTYLIYTHSSELHSLRTMGGLKSFRRTLKKFEVTILERKNLVPHQRVWFRSNYFYYPTTS